MIDLIVPENSLDKGAGVMLAFLLFTKYLYFVHMLVINPIYSSYQSNKQANKEGVNNETNIYN